MIANILLHIYNRYNFNDLLIYFNAEKERDKKKENCSEDNYLEINYISFLYYINNYKH